MCVDDTHLDCDQLVTYIVETAANAYVTSGDVVFNCCQSRRLLSMFFRFLLTHKPVTKSVISISI